MKTQLLMAIAILTSNFALPPLAFAQEKTATPAVPNPFQPIPAGPSLVQQLEAINEQFDEAFNKHDATAVAAFYTANAILRGCLKSRLRVTDHRGVMPITINTDKLYDTDLTDAAWALIGPMLPAARRGGRPRTTNIRAVLNAIFYLLRTGCQWRLLPREFPVWSTVYHYFRAWKNGGVWTCVQRSMYQQARRQAGRTACPSVVIMDGQSVKTTERGGIRGFDAHKRVKGRKRHILVDTFGLLIACRVEPADISDRRAAALLLGGLGALFPNIRTVIADAGHQSRKLARHLLQQDGWKLQIVKRRQRAFKITGLTWIVERSFAWLGRNRRLSKDYEYSVQTSETLIDIAATRLILNRLASA